MVQQFLRSSARQHPQHQIRGVPQRLIAHEPRLDTVQHRAERLTPPNRIYAMSRGHRSEFVVRHKHRMLARWPRRSPATRRRSQPHRPRRSRSTAVVLGGAGSSNCAPTGPPRVASTASDSRVVGIAVVTVVDAMMDTNGRRLGGRRQPVRRPIHAPGSGHSSVGRWIGDYRRIEDLPTVGDLPSCVPPDRAHVAASPIGWLPLARAASTQRRPAADSRAGRSRCWSARGRASLRDQGRAGQSVGGD